MSSTLYQSAAPDRFIAPWATRIIEFLIAIIEIMLTIAKNVRMPLVLSLAPSRPIVAKIENTVRPDQAAVPTMSMHNVSQMRAARRYCDGGGVDQAKSLELGIGSWRQSV